MLDVTVPKGGARRLAGVAGRHRVLSVAACIVVVLVLTGAVGALVRSPARPTITAAPLHTSVKAPAAAPTTTTTTPAFSSNGGTAQAKNAAPSGAALGPSSGTASTTTPPSTPNLPNGAVGQSAKIEQTGSLTLTVGRGKLSRTVTQLSALAVSDGGFVANSQTQSGATPSGSVTLQVPVNSFAAVLARAQALGRTSDLTTKATDVTGQYVDLQSRITALQASRQQYLTILAKATTVGDVLAVQEQIDSVQSQIEQLQGQLQLLTSQTSYSTLTVTVSESTPAAPARPPARVRPRAGVARQHRRLRHRRRGCDPARRPAALRPAAARRGCRRRTRPVAALSAPQPVGPDGSGADGGGQRDAGHGDDTHAGGRAEVLADGHRPGGVHEDRVESGGRQW